MCIRDRSTGSTVGASWGTSLPMLERASAREAAGAGQWGRSTQQARCLGLPRAGDGGNRSRNSRREHGGWHGPHGRSDREGRQAWDSVRRMIPPGRAASVMIKSATRITATGFCMGTWGERVAHTLILSRSRHDPL
eukprot:TRINITY_DN2277_c0_g1_i1.p2 TRINITY_DN2277_c0_g1~~TRINITY_DN2277_c0_g1_i1.p2  ORF type:complete len:136 (+),score=0.98 TRINITY_DN2277_c0_g1_i1:180-587(+)